MMDHSTGSNYEHQYRIERGYIQYEKEVQENLLVQQLFEEEMQQEATVQATQFAKIVLGRKVKRNSFVQHAKVLVNGRKTARFLRKPHKTNDRRVPEVVRK